MAEIRYIECTCQGLVRRVPSTSGFAHALLTWTAFQFAQGAKQSVKGNGSDQAASALLTWDAGAALLGLIGLGFVLAAVFQVRSAITAHFMRTVGAGAPAAVCWIGRVGHAARAVVFLVIGWSLIKSAWFHAGAEVIGLGGALMSLRDNGALYTLVAAGLVMFGVFSLIVARFRIIPDVERGDLKPSFH